MGSTDEGKKRRRNVAEKSMRIQLVKSLDRTLTKHLGVKRKKGGKAKQQQHQQQ